MSVDLGTWYLLPLFKNYMIPIFDELKNQNFTILKQNTNIYNTKQASLD